MFYIDISALYLNLIIFEVNIIKCSRIKKKLKINRLCFINTMNDTNETVIHFVQIILI